MSADTVSETMADVQGRIAAIQSRIGTPPVAGGGNGGNSADFSSALSGMLGVSGSDNTDALGVSGNDLGNGAPTGTDAVTAAENYLGVPYVWGGTDPTKGLDCSALTQRAYSDLGIQLPRLAADQARMGQPVASLAQAKAGDLVAFGTPVDHIGMYVGNNQMVVAPHRGGVVKIQTITATPTAIRRILPDDGTGAATTSAAGTGGIGGIGGDQYSQLFAQAGSKYGISPSLLAAVAKQESGFNPNAVSKAGAEGLMQLMPGTAKGLGVNPMDPAQAVDGAARMLSGAVNRFGSTDLALAAYNAGAGAVAKYGGIPPYAETQNYVRNVLAMSKQGA